MRYLKLVIALSFLNFGFGQNKKEQIEKLVFQCDSLDSINFKEKLIFITNKKRLESELDSLLESFLRKQKDIVLLKEKTSELKKENENFKTQINELNANLNINRKKLEDLKNILNQTKDSIDRAKNSNQINNNDIDMLIDFDLNNFINSDNKICEIDTSRFNDILYTPDEQYIKSLDENFDKILPKVHASKLKHENGGGLEYDTEELHLYTENEPIYFEGQLFTGVAFTHNDFYLDGTWRKKGVYSEFKNGLNKGKTVKYFNDGLLYQIDDDEKQLLKRYNNKGKLVFLKQGESYIEFFDNGQLRQINSQIIFDKGERGTNSLPTEEYNMNGELLEKTEYHCNRWPLIKSSINRNKTHEIGHFTDYVKWLVEIEPFLHKYSYVKAYTKTNSIIEKGIFYVYVDENGDVRGNIKDGVWVYGTKGQSKTRFIEYSSKLALMSQNRENEIKNGKFIIKEINGQVIVDGNYDNNNMDGTWKYYYKNGVLRCLANYKQGFLIGKIAYFDANGRALIEGQYNELQRLKNFELDYNIQNESESFNFPIDGRDGVFVFNYFGNGKTQKEIYTYLNGLKIGPYEIYENGVLKEKGIKP
jgi:antitoxin component YwqK of YwqJK toxin-antitoxin module